MTFGDTVGGKAYDHKALGPIGDGPRVPGGLLYDILTELIRLHSGLRAMKCECLRLEAAGMWPAVPSESWEDRNGSDKIYLRLVFPAGTRGKKRYRVYVGSKPAEVADARRKVANRRRWEELDREIGKLERLLSTTEFRLGREVVGLARYRLPALGTEHRGSGAAGVTKKEGDHAD